MWKSIKHIISFREREMKYRLLLLSIITILYSIISLFPVYVIQSLIDTISIADREKALHDILFLGSIYLILQIMAQLFYALSNLMTQKLQLCFSADLQGTLYERFRNSDLSQNLYSTALANRLIEDAKYLGHYFFSSVQIIGMSVLSFMIGVCFMVRINVYLTLIIVPFGFVTAWTSRRIAHKSEKYADQKRSAEEQLWKCFSQGILGAFTLSLYDHMQTYSQKIRACAQQVRGIGSAQSRLEQLSEFAVGSLYMITIGVIMIASAIFVSKGSISMGGLTALLMYNHMLVDPLMNWMECYQNLIKCRISIKRIQEVLSLNQTERKLIVTGVDQIVCSHVSFSYPKEQKQILSDAHFTLKRNQRYLIKGRSGIGKSTMVHLIAGFLIPQSGSIAYMAEGERMHGIPKMGYLMQDGFLFDESIQANIRIANAQLSEDEMQVLLEVCCLKEVEEALHGETIGENGSRLSGGEQKRVLLAQSLAQKECDLLIFDELSSGLDPMTYQCICERMTPYLQNKISLFIEHHPSDAMSYDGLLSIQNGIVTLKEMEKQDMGQIKEDIHQSEVASQN